MTEYVCEIVQDYPDAPYESDEFGGEIERRERVVRCRDCEFRVTPEGFCDMLQRYVMPEGFCVWGERGEG